jgi:DNA-binding transcriptional ArsR family regulator
VPRDALNPPRCAELLAALAAPERINIVRLLAGGPHNVSQIAEALDIPPLNLSHHLTVLKHAALIKGVKRGRFVFYSLRPGVLHDVVAAGIPRQVLDLGCCELAFKGKCDPKPGPEKPDVGGKK